MGLQSDEKRPDIYYLSPRANEKLPDGKVKVHSRFLVKKQSGGTITDLKPDYGVSGYFVSASNALKEIELPGGTKKKVQELRIVLTDDGALYSVQLDMNSSFGRSVANTFIGTDKIDFVRFYCQTKNDQANLGMVVYERKPLPTEKLDSVARWKYRWNETPENPRKPGEWLVKDGVKEVPDTQDPTKMNKIYHEANAKLIQDWKVQEQLMNAYAKSKGYGSDLNTAKEEAKSTPPPATNDRFGMPANRVPGKQEAPPPQAEHEPPIGYNEDDLPF